MRLSLLVPIDILPEYAYAPVECQGENCQTDVLRPAESDEIDRQSHARLGYVNNERVDTWGQPVGQSFPMPEIDSNGVDRSQIRRHLELTPFERLRSIESFLSSTMKIRRGLRRTSISPDPVSPR